MPTKRLPYKASLDHLKHQTSDLLADHHAGKPDACQRIREFHPRFLHSSDAEIRAARFIRADAYLTIAREYGFASWARLRAQVANPIDLDKAAHERIDDPVFRHALSLVDAADVRGLRQYLSQHPVVVHQRVMFEGGNYFHNPSLLEFIAENPIRHGVLSPDVVAVATVILEAGARTDQEALDSTLNLVCSGRVPRECGALMPLIDLLCRYGASPERAMGAALVHGEFEAVQELLRRGAPLDLPAAAALGRTEVVTRLIPGSTPEARHLALGFASLHGHVKATKALLDAGEDPSRYNPLGCHSHSTPLHQAALAGHMDVVRLLVERGARLDLIDIHHHARPVGWAEYAGKHEIAAYLRSHET
jgi:hypothetical protein